MIHNLILLTMICTLPSLSQTSDPGVSKPCEIIEHAQTNIEPKTAPKKAKKRSIKAEISLRDGSTLKCRIQTRRTPFTTHGQKIHVQLNTVEKVVFETPKQPAIIHFRNGDQLTGTFPVETIKTRSTLGEIDVPLAIIKEILFIQNERSDAGLIYWNTFDSEAAARSPKVGPKSTLNAGRFVEGVKGNALYTEGNSDVLSFRIPPNTLKTKGCIEFWAKLDVQNDSFGSNSHPRFFWLSRIGSSGAIRLDYNANNGRGAGGLTTIFNNVSCGSSSFSGQFSYSSILGQDFRGWHHYALVWNGNGVSTGEKNKPFVAIYVDGKMVSRQIEGSELSMQSTIDNTTEFIVACYNYSAQSRLPFAIDELKIWNYDKMEFDLK